MNQNQPPLTEKVREVIRRRAGAIEEPTLPSGPAQDVGLVTLTLDELHDLIYTATLRALRSSSTMNQDRVRHYGAMAAEESRRLALGHDGFHTGTDPRA